MSKIGKGSIQQKRGWFHLVTRDPDGKQKWTALHTQDLQIAQKRAADQFGLTSLQTDEDAWLRALIEKGEWAKRELARRTTGHIAHALPWECLIAEWKKFSKNLTRHTVTLTNYNYMIGAAARWSTAHGIATPTVMSATQARDYITECAAARSSSGRDVALLRRVWRDLGMPDIWEQAEKAAKDSPHMGTRYRRLSTEEVRRLVRTLRAGNEAGQIGWKTKGAQKALPDVADLVTIGYHTGLRRGDCAGLTVGNIDGNFLRVIPAKTASKKSRALLIPLQPEAKRVVDNLVVGVTFDGEDACLFPRLNGANIGKCLELAFDRAGVLDNQWGRASFHSLRATFISAMDESGIPPHVTDAITGHAPQGMHGRYTQPGRDSLMDAVKRAIVPLGV
ncbi:MAG: tyrosine-type recombinase/integrase [bacterium]